MPSKIHPSVWLQARRGDSYDGQILKQISISIPPIPKMSEVLVKSSAVTPISYVQWDRLDMWWRGGIHGGGAAEPTTVPPVQPTTVPHRRNLGWISEE